MTYAAEDDSSGWETGFFFFLRDFLCAVDSALIESYFLKENWNTSKACVILLHCLWLLNNHQTTRIPYETYLL